MESKKTALAFLLLAVLLAASTFNAQGQHAWVRQVVDEGEVGEYSSIALDSQGKPHISYYDGGSKDLRYARWTGSGWAVVVVDSQGDVGMYSSLALDPQDRPHIAYFERDLALKYAWWTGSRWEIEVVDGGGATQRERAGRFCSLALDPEGRPHISYIGDFSSPVLRYAYRTENGWIIEEVDERGRQWTSIAVDEAGRPHISYKDDQNHLRYARRWQGGWEIEVVDEGEDVGSHCSIALDQEGKPHIAYQDRSTYRHYDVKYAWWDGFQWRTEFAVRVQTAWNLGEGIDLAIDSQGRPHIAFEDRSDEHLEYARKLGDEWVVEVVDPDYLVGRYPSLALDNQDMPHISYFDGYYGRLKYAYMASLPGKPTLLSPSPEEVTRDVTPRFKWVPGSGAEGHRLQVSLDHEFRSIEVNVLLGPSDNFYRLTSPLDEGMYYWRVIAFNLVGERESEVRWFKVDITPPIAPELLYPPQGVTIGDNTPTFQWSGVGEEVKRYELEVEPAFDDPIIRENVLTNFYEVRLDQVLPNGNYYWRVRAVDLAGNLGEWAEGWFGVDSSLPVDNVPPPPPPLLSPELGALLSSSSVGFDWGDVEDNSGIRHYTLQLLDENLSLLREEKISTTQLELELEDGQYYWKVRAIDRVGNVGGWSQLWSFSVDTVPPPPVQLLNPPPGARTRENIPLFLWSAVEDPSGVSYTLQVDNDPDFSSPEIEVELENQTSFSPELPLLDENYAWRVLAVDGAGNASENRAYFIVDTRGPTPPQLLEPADNTATNDNTPTFKWTSVEAEVPVVYWLQVSGFENFWTLAVSASNLIENFYQVDLPDGAYYWRVCAIDNLGWKSPWSEVWTLTIDTTAPKKVELLLPSPGANLGENLVLFEWEDLGPGTTYHLQVAKKQDFDPPILDLVGLPLPRRGLTVEELGEGGFYWRVRAQDRAGNLGPWSGVWAFVIDLTPPEPPSLISPKHKASTGRTPAFDWSDVEDLSGVVYLLELDSTPNFDSPALRQLVVGNSEHKLSPEEALEEGTWYWRVKALDGAGNEGEWSVVRTFEVRSFAFPIPIAIPWRIFLALGLALGAGALAFAAILRMKPKPRAPIKRRPPSWRIFPLELSRFVSSSLLHRLRTGLGKRPAPPKRPRLRWRTFPAQLERLRKGLCLERLRNSLLKPL